MTRTTGSERSADAAGTGLRLTIEHYDTTLLLRMAGDWDLSAANRIEAAVDDARDASTRHIVFDLDAVTFLDMAAMLTLFKTNESGRSEAVDVQIVPPAGLAKRVFTLTRAAHRLTLVDAATAAHRRPPTSRPGPALVQPRIGDADEASLRVAAPAQP